jgi:hypothetical protein
MSKTPRVDEREDASPRRSDSAHRPAPRATGGGADHDVHAPRESARNPRRTSSGASQPDQKPSRRPSPPLALAAHCVLSRAWPPVGAQDRPTALPRAPRDRAPGPTLPPPLVRARISNVRFPPALFSPSRARSLRCRRPAVRLRGPSILTRRDARPRRATSLPTIFALQPSLLPEPPTLPALEPHCQSISPARTWPANSAPDHRLPSSDRKAHVHMVKLPRSSHVAPFRRPRSRLARDLASPTSEAPSLSSLRLAGPHAWAGGVGPATAQAPSWPPSSGLWPADPALAIITGTH